MQVTDMRALKMLCSYKHQIFTHCPSKRPAFISCNSLQNPQKFFRQFHSSFPHKSSQESVDVATTAWSSLSENSLSRSESSSANAPSVDAFYDPISGRVVTRRTSYGRVNGTKSESNSETESNGNVKPTNFDYGDAMGNRVYGEVIGSGNKGKGKGKNKTTWVCANCGYSDGQWWGYCKVCDSAGSMKQFSLGAENSVNGGKVTGFEVSDNVVRSWLPHKSGNKGPVRLAEVNRGTSSIDWRIPLSGLFGAEVGRVLGGGLVPGSLVLVGGDPGVGKSTLLLQTAAIIAEGHELGGAAPVVYVSGEESVEQIGNRADRMGIGTTELFLYSSTDIEDILKKAQVLEPRALVVDSIQTVYLKGVVGSAGSIYQVRECTSALLRFAKTTNIPIFLAGHVTKSGDIAGPRVLEHIVDVVLYMEGEQLSSHRLLRAVKNRFGSTDELGVFEMSHLGLQAISSPSEMFLREEYSDSDFLAGLAVAVIMDGSRTFLIEIQALCVNSSIARQVNGIKPSRADMIIAVLTKQAGLKLQENGIFLNVVSGVTLSETAADVSVAAAICSSFLEFPIPSGVAFIGEIGLGGELHMVPRMEKRVLTLAKLGYKRCVVPKYAEKHLSTLELEDMQIVGCNNLKEMINRVFRVG